jgi:hypothetical protein
MQLRLGKHSDNVTPSAAADDPPAAHSYRMNGAKKSAFGRLEKHPQLSQVFAVKKHHENRKIDLCHSIPGLATIFSRGEKMLLP